MAGEALTRLCFPQKRSRCRICGATINLRKGARLAHAAMHLKRPEGQREWRHQVREASKHLKDEIEAVIVGVDLRKHQIEHLGQ